MSRPLPPAACAAGAAADAAPRRPPQGPVKGPVPLGLLEKLHRTLAQTDVSGFVRRRRVYRLAGDAPPVPALQRLSVSLSELSHALLPVGDIAASRAVARYVGESIDRRLLALLAPVDGDLSGIGPVALPMTLSTLMSDAFRRFDEQMFRVRRNAIVLEISLTDIFDNIEDSCFACRFVRHRGYGICLVGADLRLVAAIDWSRLCFDYAAVHGDATPPSTPRAAAPVNRLASAVERIGAARLILTGADSGTAVAAGTAAGVELFLGRHVEDLHREHTRRRRLRAGLRRD